MDEVRGADGSMGRVSSPTRFRRSDENSDAFFFSLSDILTVLLLKCKKCCDQKREGKLLVCELAELNPTEQRTD